MSYEIEAITLTENQSDFYGNFGIETTDDNWDQELTGLVAANADVIIKSPWHQGVETTLSAAILAAPEINRENVHIFVAEVHRLLANQATETEEHADEEKSEPEDELEEMETPNAEKPEQELNTEDGSPKELELQQDKQSAADQSKEQNERTNHLEPAHTTTDKIPKPGEAVVTTPLPEAVVPHTQKESKNSDQNASKNIEASAVASDNFAGSAGAARTGIDKGPDITRGIPKTLTRASVTDEPGKDFIGEVPPAEAKVDDEKLVIGSENEVKQEAPVLEIPTAADSQIRANQQTEYSDSSDLMESTAEPEPAGILLLDLGSLAVFDETKEPNDEKEESANADIEPAGGEAAQVFDYQMLDSGPTDLIENEILFLDKVEAYTLEPEESDFYSLPVLGVAKEYLGAEETSITAFDDESAVSAQIKTIKPEQAFHTNLTVAEIEEAVSQLSEQLKNTEPEITEKADKILDRIIEVSARVEAQTGEEIITGSETQEQLEELFTELLDSVGMDCTPELIESLVNLTRKRHLAGKYVDLETEAEGGQARQDSGTHEFINKLLLGLSDIKKAMAHASAIGRSVLRLYFA